MRQPQEEQARAKPAEEFVVRANALPTRGQFGDAPRVLAQAQAMNPPQRARIGALREQLRRLAPQAVVASAAHQPTGVYEVATGLRQPTERLAGMLLELQARGCHNINLVTPEHVVPQILEALPLAVEDGLRLPLVYNTGGYDGMESLRHLDGIVDIYMPDFKFWDRELALKYLRARDYPEVARAAIREMHRQVGDLVMDGAGLARRGLLVRHLVMPGGIAGTREIMRFLAGEISRDTYVNVMDQYYPAGRVSREKFPEINRRIRAEEYREAIRVTREAGLHRLDRRRGILRPLAI
jgi:putative pyruvate formate lyase activating enzyme